MLTRSENSRLAERAYRRGEVMLRHLPEILTVETTNFCNLKCIMCPRGEPNLMTRPLGHMSEVLFEKIIKESPYFNSPCWIHWLGEPLMNPNLFRQIALAKRHSVEVGIHTNATLLTPGNCDLILDSGLDEMTIAVDGATPGVYESVRKGPFTYEHVRDNVVHFLARRRELGRSKPVVTLSVIVMGATAGELEQFRTFWEQHGADAIVFKELVSWAGQDARFEELAVPSQALQRRSRPARRYPCKFLWKYMTITWDGKVVPCCYDFNARMVLGDLNNQSLEEIWNGPEYLAMRRAQLRGRDVCALCENCRDGMGHTRNIWLERAEHLARRVVRRTRSLVSRSG